MSTVCEPRRGCVAVRRIIPGFSLARTQTAPVPPIKGKGLSPIRSAGPSNFSITASFAYVRIAPNSSVTRSTTRVVSAPSATSAVSSGSSVNFLSTPQPESDFEMSFSPFR